MIAVDTVSLMKALHDQLFNVNQRTHKLYNGSSG
jgi:hypothetical protein